MFSSPLNWTFWKLQEQNPRGIKPSVFIKVPFLLFVDLLLSNYRLAEYHSHRKQHAVGISAVQLDQKFKRNLQESI